jgi:hypothetical protein
MRRASLNEPVLTSNANFASDPRLPRAGLDDLLVIPSWRSRRERAMSSSSFFKTLPFAVQPLARLYRSHGRIVALDVS